MHVYLLATHPCTTRHTPHHHPPPTGQLSYTVPAGRNAVLVFGGNLGSVECNVRDQTGRQVCGKTIENWGATLTSTIYEKAMQRVVEKPCTTFAMPTMPP